MLALFLNGVRGIVVAAAGIQCFVYEANGRASVMVNSRGCFYEVSGGFLVKILLWKEGRN